MFVLFFSPIGTVYVDVNFYFYFLFCLLFVLLYVLLVVLV